MQKTDDDFIRASPINPYKFTYVLKQLIRYPTLQRSNDLKYQRPPYPIIKQCPHIQDVWQETKLVDAAVAAALASLPYACYLYAKIFKPITISRESTKIWIGANILASLLFGLSLSAIPRERLKGYYDNGLRWRRKDKEEKYDTLSDFLQQHPSYAMLLPNEQDK